MAPSIPFNVINDEGNNAKYSYDIAQNNSKLSFFLPIKNKKSVMIKNTIVPTA